MITLSFRWIDLEYVNICIMWMDLSQVKWPIMWMNSEYVNSRFSPGEVTNHGNGFTITLAFDVLWWISVVYRMLVDGRGKEFLEWRTVGTVGSWVPISDPKESWKAAKCPDSSWPWCFSWPGLMHYFHPVTVGARFCLTQVLFASMHCLGPKTV